MKQDLIMDVGMYDGSDTAYYLARGYRVVAIEANPFYAQSGRERFASEIAAGRLEIVNKGIGPCTGTIPFYVCAEDPGSSSFNFGHLGGRTVLETLLVSCVPFKEILDRYGIPFYLKIDIEGHDTFCLDVLSPPDLPPYVSWEAGENVLRLMASLATIGYTGFKFINQSNFRELRYIGSFQDRVSSKLRRVLGKPAPQKVRRYGYDFVVEHSAGPMAEETDGAWRSWENVQRAWSNKRTEQQSGWYDIHARLWSAF